MISSYYCRGTFPQNVLLVAPFIVLFVLHNCTFRFADHKWERLCCLILSLYSFSSFSIVLPYFSRGAYRCPHISSIAVGKPISFTATAKI